MGTANEPEPVDVNELDRDTVEPPENGAPDGSEMDRDQDIEMDQDNLTSSPMDRGLPVEPDLPWEEPVADGYDADNAFTALQSFYLYGSVGPEPVKHASPSWPTPALLSGYTDLSHIRYDYPICLTDVSGDGPMQSLTEIVDDVTAVVADDSDDGQRLKRHIHQLESAVKTLAEKNPGQRLSTLWNRAADEVLAKTQLTDDAKRLLREDLKIARGALQTDGEVHTCRPGTPSRLFETVVRHEWNKRCAGWREELDALIQELDDILAADFARSPEAMSPEHLRASSGSPGDEDLDFQAMSSILKQSDLGETIPEDRRKRIEETLAILRGVRPIYSGEAMGAEENPETMLRIDIIENDCAAAVHRFVDQMQTLVDFFKAVRIARLEKENRYHAPVHDAFFARFGVIHLTVDEFALCPPVLLRLTNEFFAGQDKGAVLDILSAGIPIKVLVELDDLFYNGKTAADLTVTLSWPARLANLAAALNHVFVMQSPVSNPILMDRGFADGFNFDGPALFSVYTGSRDNQPGLSTYHNAAAATESRIFPSLTYDPAGGDTLVDRSSVEENPQLERTWPTETFAYQDLLQDELETELEFTPADFLLCDVRLAGHFWRVPATMWHRDMVPLADFLLLDEETADTKVPYLIAVGIDNDVERVVMTRVVVSFVRQCGLFWRQVQELGGVNNSFAEKALREEKGRLEEEKQSEVKTVEAQYETQLNRNIGDLTREIIQRIVDQIASGGGLGTAAAEGREAAAVSVPETAPPPAEAPEAETEAPEPVEAEEEEEEGVSFDDPYIDSPLCTSCNECTNLNSRMFAYNDNKQAYIKDGLAGTYRELVTAAEKCPVHIIHPGKPKNPDEPGLDELIKRGDKFN